MKMKSPLEKEMEKVNKQMLLFVISKMGNGETTTDQLDKFGYSYIKGYLGAHPYDMIPSMKHNQSIIINEGSSRTDGYHWMALVRIHDTYYLYDSFGRTPDKIFKKSFLENKKIVGSDKYIQDREQQDMTLFDKKTEKNCGQRALSWLMNVNQYGINKARLI